MLIQKEIKTKRLRLKPLGMQYLESTHAYASDIENTRLMVNLPNDTIEDTITFLKKVENEWKKEIPDFYEFAIILNEVHIGGMGIYLEADSSSAEIGWTIHKQYWRQGYATEAAQALLDFATQQLGVKHLIAHCDAENIASYKVMEHLGMHLTSRYFGRKNKSSDEDREELMYEMQLVE